jgi:hypothetical protein
MGQTLWRTPRISVRGVSFGDFPFSSDDFNDAPKFIKCAFKPFLRSGCGTQLHLDSVDRYSPHVIASSSVSTYRPSILFDFRFQ